MRTVPWRILLPLFLLAACVGYPHAQRPAADPVAQSTITHIYRVRIPDYTFPNCDLTNCYILAGKTGQAILIDPAEQLSPVVGKKLLMDKETIESTTIATDDLAAYEVVSQNANGPVIVRDAKTTKEYFVYDRFTTTGQYGPEILRTLTEHKLTLKIIIISHGHLDHFGAVTYLKAKTGAEVLMHADDLRSLTGAKVVAKDGEAPVGYPKDAYRIDGITTKVDRTVTDGEVISLDGMALQVLFTPGHSPGSICLRTQQHGKPLLFSGDTLLHWGYLQDMFGNILHDAQGNPLTDDTGRTNFVDGSGDQALLYRMIREKLLTLSEDTIVYPGHGEETTIKEETRYSPARVVPPAETKTATP